MPRIAVTAADLWKTRAKRWRKQNQGVQAEHLSLAERRESSRARAAFWVATAPPRQGPPHPEACQACGLSTHAWCEGCYCRVGGSEEPFSALVPAVRPGQAGLPAVCRLGRELGPGPSSLRPNPWRRNRGFDRDLPHSRGPTKAHQAPGPREGDGCPH